MKSHFEPSQAALDFCNEVQGATGNYFGGELNGYWHITQTLKKYGKNWTILNGSADEREEAMATLADHARQRRAEKLQETTNGQTS